MTTLTLAPEKVEFREVADADRVRDLIARYKEWKRYVEKQQAQLDAIAAQLGDELGDARALTVNGITILERTTAQRRSSAEWLKLHYPDVYEQSKQLTTPRSFRVL